VSPASTRRPDDARYATAKSRRPKELDLLTRLAVEAGRAITREA
jgi:hypothetical protein